MRNLLRQKILLSALVVAFALAGCKKKEVKPKKDKPTVTVAATVKKKGFKSGGSVTKGDTIAFAANVKALGGFTSLEIFKGAKSVKKYDRKSLKLGAGATEAKNVRWEYLTSKDKEGSDIVLKFTATDSLKQSSSVEFKFKVSNKPDAPTATVTAKVKKQNFQSEGEVTKGDTVVFTANVNAPGKFTSLEVFKAGASVKKFDKLTKAKNVLYEYYTVNDQEGSDVVLKFTVTDDLKQNSSVEFKFKVKKSVVDSPKPSKPVKLYAPTTDNKSKTFFIVGDASYAISELDGAGDESSSSEWIDFGYFYGGDAKGASLVASKEYEAFSSLKFPSTWKVKKDCKFSAVLSIDKAKFDSMKEGDEVKNAMKGKTIDKSSVTGLKEGDVFAFKTIDEYASFSGLMKVSKLKKGSGSDGFIEIVVKLNEKQASGGGLF